MVINSSLGTHLLVHSAHRFSERAAAHAPMATPLPRPFRRSASTGPFGVKEAPDLDLGPGPYLETPDMTCVLIGSLTMFGLQKQGSISF